MSQLKAHRFADVEFFKTLCPERLGRLLRPHEAFFISHGLCLEHLQDQEHLALLATCILEHCDALPGGLVDALCCVQEMASLWGMDRLLGELPSRGFTLAASVDEMSPADVAAEVWLNHPDVFEDLHSLEQVKKVRSVYVSEGAGTPESLEDPARLDKLEEMALALEKRLEKTGRGKGCRILVHPEGDKLRFAVRRGDPVRREGCLQNHGRTPASVVYRPEKYDVLVYDPARDELQHTLALKAVREAYLQVFGEFLFGNALYFTWGNKFSLEPLRQDGASALACADVAGMEEVCLTELCMGLGDPNDEKLSYQADNVFLMLEHREEGIPMEVRLSKAKFRVKYQDRRRPRTVEITPPFKTTFTRDGDGQIVEDWLIRRGFLKQRTMGTQRHVGNA